MSAKSQVQNKGLWGMSKPLLVEQALQFSVPLLDTIFLSIVSDSAASAAGALAPILFFCGNMLWVVVFAGASVAGQRMGADDYGKANATIVTYGLWAALLSLLIGGLLYLVSTWLVTTMGLPGASREMGITYLEITSLLVVVWGAKHIFQSILNVYGIPKWNMLANAVFFFANVLGNAIVVFGLFGVPKMGIEGVAWASVIASASGVLVAVLVVIFKLKLPVTRADMRAHFRSASRHIFSIALPSAAEPMLFELNMVALNTMAAKLGAVALAAKVYTFNTFMICLIVTVALTTATQMLVSQFIGKGDLTKADSQLKHSLKVALLGSGGIALAVVLLHQPIIRLYSDNPELLAGALLWFLLSGITELPRTSNVLVGNVLRATGDGWYVSIMGPAITWGVCIPLAYVLAFWMDWGVTGLLVAALLDEGIRGVLCYLRWRKGKWRHKNVYAKEQQLQV